jgi:hypothetical protein
MGVEGSWRWSPVAGVANGSWTEAVRRARVGVRTYAVAGSGDVEDPVEMLVLGIGLVGTLLVLIATWRRGRRRQAESTSRMQQDIHTFHEQLHQAPGRSRPGRYRGPGQGWG